jgi:hypothetical protein
MFYFPDDKSTLAKPPNEGFQGICSCSRFQDDKSTLAKPPNEGFQIIRSRSRFQGDLQSHYGDPVS